MPWTVGCLLCVILLRLNVFSAGLTDTEEWVNTICPLQTYPAPKVAYCVAGLPRTFYEPNVYVSFKRNIVDSFGGDPYIFIALENSGVNKSLFNNAFNHLKMNIKNISWFDPFSTDYISSLVNPHVTFSLSMNDKMYVQRVIRQYANVQLCFEMMTQFEQLNSISFDWVFRIRSDMVYFNSIEPYCLHHPDVAEHYHEDFFDLIPRKYAGSLFLLNQFYSQLSGSFPFITCAEHLLAYSFRTINVTFILSHIRSYPRRLNSHQNLPMNCFENYLELTRSYDKLFERTLRCHRILHPQLSYVSAYAQNLAVFNIYKKSVNS